MNFARRFKLNFLNNSIKHGNFNENYNKLLAQVRKKTTQAAAGAASGDDNGKKANADEERTTHFGFQKVKESEKDKKGNS